MDIIKDKLPEFDYDKYFSFLPVDLDAALVNLFTEGYIMSVNVPNFCKKLLFEDNFTNKILIINFK